MKYFLLLFWLFATTSSAVEVVQGKLYSAGSYVESSQTGVGLTIPPGWQAAWPAGSEMFVLESADLKASIFMAFQPSDEAGLKTWMSNSIMLDLTTQLVPITRPKKIGQSYTASYSVTGSSSLSAYIAARILPPSNGVAFIALSTGTSTMSQVEKVTLKLANSLTVKPPTATSVADSHSALWKDYFKGRHIVRYFTRSAYSENQHLWLCSDGRFFRHFGSGGFSMSSGASGASISSGQGQWTATGSTDREGQLILQFGAGSTSDINLPGGDYSSSGAGGERWIYRVTLDDKLYLDGVKWLRGKNEQCS